MTASLHAAAGRRRIAPFRHVTPRLGLVDVSRAPYGCDASGRNDSTEALQRAISDHVGEYSVLYLPPGTYTLSDTLYWRDGDGRFAGKVTLQGAGRDQVRLRLVDGASGFGAPGTPKAVIFTASDRGVRPPDSGGRDHVRLGEGNEGYRNNVQDLTIDAGDNPGAVGIDWLAHNNGVIEWVRVEGRGFCGIDMSRRWPGPCLLRNVEVAGFDYGIRFLGPESNVACDRVVVRDQRRAGVHNSGGGLMSFFALRSVNRVPVLESHDSGTQTVLVDCDLTDGSPDADALVGDGPVTIEGVRWSGYRRLRAGVRTSPAAVVTPRPVRQLGDFDVAAVGRNHPTVEVGRPEEWTLVTDHGADPSNYDDDTEAIRAAMDSGSRVVVFPAPRDVSPATYLLSDTVDVPVHVDAIVGWHTTVSSLPGSFDAATTQRPMWRVAGPTQQPLMFQGMRMGLYQGPAPALEPMILHESPRDLVLTRMTVSAEIGYRGAGDAGDLYCSDYCCGRIELAPGQRLWARQLNIEGESSPQLLVAADVHAWVLGMKTEQPVTACEVSGRLALIGGFHSVIRQPPPDTPCIKVNDGGAVWCAYGTSGYLPGAHFEPQIVDVDRIVRRDELPDRGGQGSLVTLYAHDG